MLAKLRDEIGIKNPKMRNQVDYADRDSARSQVLPEDIGLLGGCGSISVDDMKKRRLFSRAFSER